MMFSKACEYGIRAQLYVAKCSLNSERVSLNEIAEEIDSPNAFTAKILQKLAKSNLLVSIKGPKGGFEIPAERLEEIRLIEVVEAIDGDKLFTGCGLGLKECSELKPCPVHNQFKVVREELKNMLVKTRLFDLAQSLEMGISFLKKE